MVIIIIALLIIASLAAVMGFRLSRNALIIYGIFICCLGLAIITALPYFISCI